MAGLARGEIVNATGKVDWLISAPSDARLRGSGSITGSTLIRAWDEKQNFTLEGDLVVDAAAPGTFDRASQLGSIVIPAGQEVSSHAVFLKPASSLAVAQTILSFDAEIIGVIVTDATSARRVGGRLGASDFLGASLFDSNLLNRGLEIGSDWFQISADRLSITFSLRASNPGDFARIITRSAESQAFFGAELGGSFATALSDWPAESLPAPGGVVLAGLACLVAARRGR